VDIREFTTVGSEDVGRAIHSSILIIPEACEFLCTQFRVFEWPSKLDFKRAE
jgi:hypothetical protein